MWLFVGMKCLQHLKAVYINRKGVESTRWPKLGDPSIYIDVTIVKARRVTDTMCQEHAMGLANGRVGKRPLNNVTVEELLRVEHGKVVLIEGDPGAGKTTLTFHICKEWANGNLLEDEAVFWIPLRHYHKSVSNINELFEKLNCLEIKEYVMRSGGKGLIFILDGWDELPDDLQQNSFFHDMIFDDTKLVHSTIIVTSRPNCSGDIVERVHGTQAHYRIMGFSPEKAAEYIHKYFKDDEDNGDALLAFLKNRENLRRDFYIPITVAIMCYVYRYSGNNMPETLSQLYENFVLLFVCNHIPKTYKKFKSIKKLPEKLWPLFKKLCKLAFDMLVKSKVVISEEELDITEEDLTCLPLQTVDHFDGFGLLQIMHTTDKLGDLEKYYCFLHRAVQELLAAIYLWKSDMIEDTIDRYFKPGSFLMNVFPYMFGLVPKEHLGPLADRLRQAFIKSGRNRKLLSSILFCLFEAQDESLCREFGKVFGEEKDVNLQLATVLEYRYASYFLSTCGGSNFNVDFSHSTELAELHAEVMAKYFCNSSTDVKSFKCLVQLSLEGMEHFAKILSYQPNLQSIKLYSIGFHSPGCVKVLCDSICRSNPQLTDLDLPYAKVSKDDLNSLGLLLATAIEGLHMNECSPSEGVLLTSVESFLTSMHKSKSLKEFCLGGWSLSQVESEAFGEMLSQNKGIKGLHALQVTDADCLCPILNGLSVNSTVTLLKAWPKSTGSSNTLGQCLGKCLATNESLVIIDFACFSDKHVTWSPAQVGSICKGLHNNITMVTLDISGCSIDSAASDAVSVMLSSNTSLRHLFLNPCHIEKPEAVTIINSCRSNSTLELLSLVQWPEKKFHFATDKEIVEVLFQVHHQSRQGRGHPILKIYWLVHHCGNCVMLIMLTGRPMNVVQQRTNYIQENNLPYRLEFIVYHILLYYS